MLPWRAIRADIEFIRERDPAAQSIWEVILAYPGFQARLLHRLAHSLSRANVPLFPRLVSHLNRALTGIKIHPGAAIGEPAPVPSSRQPVPPHSA